MKRKGDFSKKMNILVTNDDGITAPGLLALVNGVSQSGKVFVLAPERNWSASGHSRTIDNPLRVNQTELEGGIAAWSCDGSPADCVALAANGFFGEKIDLVISGINSSANLSHDVALSGTVAAAREAAIWKIPAMAVSLDLPAGCKDVRDYQAAAQVTARVLETVVRNTLPNGTFLNINVPFMIYEQLKGIQVTRLGERVYHDKLEARLDPRGNTYYWLVGQAPGGVPEPGTDIGALARGYVSITPLQLDQTANYFADEFDQWDWEALPAALASDVLVPEGGHHIYSLPSLQGIYF
jgi:5'-nucleotidase